MACDSCRWLAVNENLCCVLIQVSERYIVRYTSKLAVGVFKVKTAAL